MSDEVKNSTSSGKGSKKDKKKRKEEKTRKYQSIEVEDEHTSTVEESEEAPPPLKKDKKRKMHTRTVTTNEESCDDGAAEDTEGYDDKEARREARKAERLARKKEKNHFMEKVPKVDEDGIAYTKLQIKRMAKRVKQGLPPVPTLEEERQRLRNEAQLRREEEAELAGMIFRKEDGGSDDDSDEKPTGEDANDEFDGDDDNDESEAEKEEVDQLPGKLAKEAQQPLKKKSKRSKLVPPDYVCQACKNKHTPVHWIYDCPDKVTVKGSNAKKKKERGLNLPDSRKVFVSGLPFDVKTGDINQLFQGCGNVVSCKLVKFGDTGRCNGQAYVSFDSDEAATKSLKLSGTTIDTQKEENSRKKSKKSDTSPSKRPELKLKVSRVLNRRLTKKKPL